MQTIAVTPWLAGDPRRLPALRPTAGAILEALGLTPDARAGLLTLGAGAAVLHSFAAGHASLALHVLAEPSLDDRSGVSTPRLVFALTGPLRAAGQAIRLIGRLRAGCADAALVAKSAAATTREDLVRALGPLDGADEESPLATAEVLAVGSAL